MFAEGNSPFGTCLCPVALAGTSVKALVKALVQYYRHQSEIAREQLSHATTDLWISRFYKTTAERHHALFLVLQDLCKCHTWSVDVLNRPFDSDAVIESRLMTTLSCGGKHHWPAVCGCIHTNCWLLMSRVAFEAADHSVSRASLGQ